MGSELSCFGRAERYLGMSSLTMGQLDAAEGGHAAEADAMLAVTTEQARTNGLHHLERLATTELGRPQRV